MSATEFLTLSNSTHLTDATCYHRVLGRLQYLSFTRPDIAYEVNKLSQFMQAPSDLHWKAVKRVLRYLCGTIQLGLRVTPIKDFNLHVYSDADWDESFHIWSEYREVANALSETMWVTNLLTEFCFPVHQLPTIYYDNLGATFLSKNPVLHSRVKHAAVDFHFVRHHVEAKKKNKHDAGLLEKLEDILLGLQIVLSDAENKQASDPLMRKWLNKLQRAVDGVENLLEEFNYEALRLKVEGQHQNLVETSNQQVSDLNLSLSNDFFLNIEEKLKDTITKLEVLGKKIGRLGLQKHFDSGKKIETRTPSTSLIDESDVFGRQNEIDEFIDRLLSKDASEKTLTVVPIVGMGGVGKTTLAKAAYNDKKVKSYFTLKAWFCVSEPYDAIRITKGLLKEIGSFDLKDDNNINQLQVKLKESLKGKRFLIVLDDMWNDDYNEWNDL
ncbi:putative disease resistance RPP13-like protein 1-like [Capsicum annuum]|nr:putative disease resistance RPP13-like protein 1-like [Capsicum annuum]